MNMMSPAATLETYTAPITEMREDRSQTSKAMDNDERSGDREGHHLGPLQNQYVASLQRQSKTGNQNRGPEDSYKKELKQMLKSIDARHAHEANTSGAAKPKMLDAMKRKLVADYEAQMSHGVKFKALKMSMRHANSIINTAYKGQKTVETQFL